MLKAEIDDVVNQSSVIHKNNQTLL